MTGKESLISLDCNGITREKIYLKLQVRNFHLLKVSFHAGIFFFLKGGVIFNVDVGMSEICGFYYYEGFQHKPVGAFLVNSAS